MATSMATSMSMGMATNSPIMSNGLGLNGNLTPSHTIIKREYCESVASSVHSPNSNHCSTPNTINTIGPGSMSNGPGSAMNCNSNGSGDMDSSSENMMDSNQNSNSSLDIFGSKCKRKINFSNLGMPGRTHQPATVARRNARERNRVKQVNNGFASLKQHIPLGHRSKKMSKVETLRCAVDYIKNLQGLLTIHNSFNVASPADSNASTNSGDILMDDENVELHQSTQQQHQMNGVNNQRDAYALSSSSSSSSPSSSEFDAVVAHLPHHLSALHSLHSHHQSNQQQQQQQQHLGNNNQLRHLSLSHHHLHGTNGLSAAAALLLESGSNAVTPNSNQLSPTSSENPSSPSYTSEVSYVNSNSNGNLKGNGGYDYEKYEPVSPEDEELLDAIAWWQQS